MMSDITFQDDLKVFFDKPSHQLDTTRINKSNKISFGLHLPFRADRVHVEKFIHHGFKKHYQADIQHFLPNLISIGVGKNVVSALGFRSAATQPLFLEQYLNENIEFFFNKEHIARQQIGEIGNLYGTKRPLTLKLFIITILALAQSRYKKLVFCATPQVKAIFDQFSVRTQHIGHANPQKIGSQLKHWGSYYQTTPELFAIDIDHVIAIINQSRVLSKISYKFVSEVSTLACNLIK